MEQKKCDKVDSLLMICKIYATISDEAKDILEQNWQVTRIYCLSKSPQTFLGHARDPSNCKSEVERDWKYAIGFFVSQISIFGSEAQMQIFVVSRMG